VSSRPREKLWVVRDGDGNTVEAIVVRAGEGRAAIEDGRVFIGKKRVTRPDHPVRAGDAIRIGAARTADTDKEPTIEILFHEDGLVACVKPAGLPTVPDHASTSRSLVALVAKAVGRRTEELRITSRLDRDVSGVVLFALDAAAEERLKAARAEGLYRRRYVALASIATGTSLEEVGTWDAPIGRASDPRLRAIAGADAKDSTTRWRRIALTSGRLEVALLAVDPLTGRTHQIRIHASHAHAPLIGDRDYGGPTRLVLPNGTIRSPSRIALHAARVIVPGVHGALEARAPIPAELAGLWSDLGGDASDWERALTAETSA
jgi:23S rRNA pseudouridine1911/1915/1917 synthase